MLNKDRPQLREKPVAQKNPLDGYDFEKDVGGGAESLVFFLKMQMEKEELQNT